MPEQKHLKEILIVGGGSASGAFDNTSVTTAELARSVTAAALTLSADADRSYSADATATAGGGKDEAAGNNSTSSETLDKTQSAQVGTNGQDPGDSSKSSGGKVSGIRHTNQMTVTTLTTAIMLKISRHDPISRMNCPMLGAMIGKIMKVMTARLLTRAIARPE